MGRKVNHTQQKQNLATQSRRFPQLKPTLEKGGRALRAQSTEPTKQIQSRIEKKAI